MTGAHQLWVSDITYWQLGAVYLSLLTDAYSPKLGGYHLGERLASIHSIKALEMALCGVAHHCSKRYINLLEEQEIAGSNPKVSFQSPGTEGQQVNHSVRCSTIPRQAVS